MSSETIDINEAANRMEELLQAVEKGHWIITTQDGAPVAALVRRGIGLEDARTGTLRGRMVPTIRPRTFATTCEG